MGTHWAIAIGINQYPSFQPLEYAQQDAEALQRFWQENLGLPSHQGLLLAETAPRIQDRPTFPQRDVIMNWIQWICNEQLQPQDVLWIFFSGHGLCYQGEDYLVPWDGDPQRVPETTIAVRSLLHLLHGAGSSQVLLILDINRSQGVQSTTLPGQQTLELSRQFGIATLLSAQPDQFSYESRHLRQGLFTTALIEGLRLQDCQTLGALQHYLDERLPQLCDHSWRPLQTIATAGSPQFSLYPSPAPTSPGAEGDSLTLDHKFAGASALGSGSVGVSTLGATGMGLGRIQDRVMGDRPPGETLDRPPSPWPSPAAPLPLEATALTLDQVRSQQNSGGEDTPPGTPPNPLPSTLLVAPTNPAQPDRETLPHPLGRWLPLGWLAPLKTLTARIPTLPSLIFKGQRVPLWVWLVGGAIALPVGMQALAPQRLTQWREALSQAFSTFPNSPPSPSSSPTAPPTVSFSQTLIQQSQPGQAPAGVLDPTGLSLDSPTDGAGDPNATPNPAQGSEAPGNPAPGEPAEGADGQRLYLRNQRILEEARTLIQGNQASRFSDAIAKARLIAPDQPLYSEAQADIDRWSQTIFDTAVGRAHRGDYQGAIAAVQLVPLDRPIGRDAAKAIEYWTILNGQKQKNVTMLEEAQLLIEPDSASSYNDAIAIVRAIPEGEIYFFEAQRFMGEWSREILRIAEERADAGRYAAAIAAAQLVPAGTPNYAAAQGAIVRWQKLATE